MADKFDDRNRGSIWANKKKREGKQDPDFTGSLNVDGKDYWVSAWKRKPDARDSAPALSFSVKQKDGKPQQQENAPSAPRRSMKEDMDGDEIPFAPEFR